MNHEVPIIDFSDNEDRPLQDTGLASELKKLIAQLSLSRATELARHRYYSQALGIISGLGDAVVINPYILDLQARIFAQQGELAKAHECWTNALQIDPSNGEYSAGLRRIEKTIRRPALLRMGRSIIVAAFLITGITIVGFLFIEVFRLRSRNATPSFGDASFTVPGQRPSPTQGQLNISITGSSFETRANGSLIVFHSGLFNRGTNLTLEARNALNELAAQLKLQTEGVVVNVEGHTSDTNLRSTKDFQDNTSLGMQRSAAVIDYLRSNARLPASMFLASSAGELQPPFPNDSPENQLKNQTVVIRIMNRN